MVTIREIAEMAAVSTATVSNVIHGKTKKVSPATIGRIQQLLQQHQYVEKMGLRVLNNGKSQIVCLVTNASIDYEDTIFSDPFYGQILGAVEQQLRNSGYYLMVYVSDDVNDIFRTVAAWNVDGIIALSFHANDCEKLASLTGKPVVSIDVMGPASNAFYNVGLADKEGGRQMTQYLLDCGYKTIWVLANKNYGLDHDRWLGHKAALEKSKLPCHTSHFVAIGETQKQRQKDYKKLLPQLHQNDALFFLSDFYAIEFIGFLASQKKRVPEDFAVAGFDNTIYSQMCVPKLTTVQQNIPEKGRVAANTMMAILAGDTPTENEVLLPVELVVRGSVKKLPATASPVPATMGKATKPNGCLVGKTNIP